MRRLTLPLACLLFAAASGSADAPKNSKLPTKNARDVVFSDDFENFDRQRWNEISDKADAVAIVDGGPSGQGKCVQITHRLNQNTGGHLYKMLEPGLDACHLRFYVKFEKGHDFIHHFVHLCGYNPPTRYPQGGAGERPKGDERF